MIELKSSPLCGGEARLLVNDGVKYFVLNTALHQRFWWTANVAKPTLLKKQSKHGTEERRRKNDCNTN